MFNNNEQNQFTQLVPIQPPVLAPVTFIPQLIPIQPQPLPIQAPVTLPNWSMLPSSLPIGTNVKFWDQMTNNIVDQIPTNLLQATTEQIVCPLGFSFVLMDVDGRESVSSEAPIAPVVAPSVSRSMDVSRPPQQTEEPVVSRQGTPEPDDTKRKYKHRSKQDRIELRHAQVKDKYTAMGIYAADDEVLRGFDTVRVHVKTYRGLDKIFCPLEDIELDHRVQVLKIATPFSMKNKFQKKGFIVYLKLADRNQVPVVQEIFSNYADYFPKCDIALKKEDKLRLEREAEERKLAPLLALEKLPEMSSWEDAWDLDLDILAPPAMTKQGSLSSIAA